MSAASEYPAERLVAWTLRATWPFYFIGALYLVAPILGWFLGVLSVLSLYLGPAMRDDLQATGPVPPVIWAWILGMVTLLIALWVGHSDWALGPAQTLKSTIGWAKGWALLALFPLAGAVLPIRRAPLVRAQCVVGLWTLCILPLCVASPYVGLPSQLFTSPLEIVGGPGPEYFTVFLFTFDPATWTPRWQFYAPWSPFAGLLGVVMVLFALEEQDRRWMIVGLLAGLAMVLLSKSRMSFVAVIVCTIGPRLMPILLRGWAWQASAAIAASMAMFGSSVLQAMQDTAAAFRAARADSSRVREALQRIAEERWQSDALWFGHGTVRPGSHLVEHMPIGSHHTWYGLLFVKGAVGFAALLVPFVWQTAISLIDAAKGPRGRLPLGIMLVFAVLSFGENIEIEAYLLWPALLILGIHARELSHGQARDLADQN